MRCIVTSPLSAESLSPDLEQFLQDSGLTYIPRRGRSLQLLADENQANGVVVWKSSGPILYAGSQQFFFHPSMAKIRIGAYRKQGTIDPLIRAAQANEGDSWLDCTLGLGADAIVAAYFTKSPVTGLESSPVVAAIIKWGMRLFRSEIIWLQEPVQQITVMNIDHLPFLTQQPDKSYDIVYFDPMFRQPVMKSQALSPLRSLADPRALTEDTLTQACRVARKRVVIKERSVGCEFTRLGIDNVQAASGSKLAYGIINIC